MKLQPENALTPVNLIKYATEWIKHECIRIKHATAPTIFENALTQWVYSQRMHSLQWV